MLARARADAEAAGLGNVAFEQGDAQVHPLGPARFDTVISRFGIMFFADPVAAFRNLIAALKPGGRLCTAVWATLAENVHWKIPLEIAIRHLGPPAPQPPHTPGPHAFGDRDYLRGILAAAGFADIAIKPRDFHIRGDTPAAMAEHVGMFGVVQRLMDEKAADDATR
jgi:SAM-dependent methyltransferase